MNAAKAVPPPLFQPPEIGLDIDTWDEMPKPTRPRCSECDRPLRSKESQDAEIGPCCAAKIGRAVAAQRKASRVRKTA